MTRFQQFVNRILTIAGQNMNSSYLIVTGENFEQMTFNRYWASLEQ